MSEATDVRAELRLAEDRLAEVRARNAQLESALLKPTAMRNRMLATIVLAALGGTLAYLGANRVGDARTARAQAKSTAMSEDLLALHRGALDTCKQLLQKEKNDTLQCAADLDAARSKLPAVPEPPPARVGSKCSCEPGDPLCSCL